MPLKGIPFMLSPEILHALASAGHGDDIVLADAHFPTSSICRRGPKEIRADGHGIPALLKAILHLLPLDTYVDCPVALMARVPEDEARNLDVPVWPVYQQIINDAEHKEVQMEYVERFAFYSRAEKAFAIIATGETAQYGNIILKKGIVIPKV